jgi:hypothetical protein
MYSRLLAFAGAALAMLFSASPAQAQNPCNLKTGPILAEIYRPHRDELTVVVAHRGLHAVLGNPEYTTTPENSLQSLENAAQRCFEAAEIDIRLTSGREPILSHDFRWGREAEVGSSGVYYDPWQNTGPNPEVSKTPLKDAKTYRLRNSMNFKPSPWGEHPPTLAEAYSFYQSKGMAMVLFLDVKDPEALREAWRVTVAAGMEDKVIFKMDAKHFPKPSLFENYMNETHYVYPNDDDGPRDARFIRFIPVYNTENIRPNNEFGTAGGESKVVQSIQWYKSWAANGGSRFLFGIEVNMKDYGAILASSIIESSQNGNNSTAIFNPYREYTGGGKNAYFKSDGFCCVELSEYWFNKNNEYPGLPRDTTDRRTQWDSFLRDHVQQGYVTMITTDNAVEIAGKLKDIGRRNTKKYFGG